MPIIPDEARTFGMDPLFKEVGIYSALGQLYDPVDSNLVLSYREATDGQVLEEGITEAGSSASFQAAGTSYATHAEPMIPFYIFYSMFGFQRTGDEFWAFGDARGRGFLLGATAGRTTLNGEGLQHEDGHSLVLASHYPDVPRLRPGVRLRDRGHHPRRHRAHVRRRARGRLLLPDALQRELRDAARGPSGVTDEDIVRGLYRFRPAPDRRMRPRRRATIARGRRLDHAAGAARPRHLLAERGVAAEVWSAPSYQLLRNEALEVERWNRLHPGEAPRVAARHRAARRAGAAGPDRRRVATTSRPGRT